MVEPDTFAHEYEIYGDFVVGDSFRHRYLLVEFENGDRDYCDGITLERVHLLRFPHV